LNKKTVTRKKEGLREADREMCAEEKEKRDGCFRKMGCFYFGRDKGRVISQPGVGFNLAGARRLGLLG